MQMHTGNTGNYSQCKMQLGVEYCALPSLLTVVSLLFDFQDLLLFKWQSSSAVAPENGATKLQSSLTTNHEVSFYQETYTEMNTETLFILPRSLEHMFSWNQVCHTRQIKAIVSHATQPLPPLWTSPGEGATVQCTSREFSPGKNNLVKTGRTYWRK